MADLAYLALPIVPDEGFPQAFRLAFNNASYVVSLYVNVPEADLNALPDDGFLVLGEIGTVVRAPAAPALVAAAAAGSGLGIGTYRYSMSFVNPSFETPVSAEVTVATAAGNQQVHLTAIETGPPGTTARKIYRSAVNGPAGSAQLLTRVADNTTTTFTDMTADAALGVGNRPSSQPRPENSFMVMRVTRESPGGPQTVFFRRLVPNLAYAAVELSFWFRTITIARRNINGVGAFGSQVEGFVAAQWAL